MEQVGYKVILTSEEVYVDSWEEGYGPTKTSVYRQVFKEVEDFPTLEGAMGWRSTNEKFEGQFIIVPYY